MAADDKKLEPYLRAETGHYRFGPDWAGLFIRGDNCMGYAMYLEQLIRELEKKGCDNFFAFHGVKGLLSMLQGANEHTLAAPGEDVAAEDRWLCEAIELKPYKEAVADLDLVVRREERLKELRDEHMRRVEEEMRARAAADKTEEE